MRREKIRTGFTLVEVMVATAVLALGSVLIYEILFKSLDIFNYSLNYMNTISWLNEELWQTQNDLMRYGAVSDAAWSGSFVSRGRRYDWAISYALLDKDAGLFRIDVEISGDKFMRNRCISRTAYALYRERK